jgi:Domain of unknown function (DUF4442)
MKSIVSEDPFAPSGSSNVLEADASHAVAEQRPAPELDNHIGARHAGALYAVGYAASRAMVVAALGQRSGPLGLRLIDSEVVYEKAATGAITAIAEPGSGDWEALLSRASRSEKTQLPTSVTLRNEDGQTVTTMSVLWQVAPHGA